MGPIGCPAPETPKHNPAFFILDPRRVLHPAPAGAGLQNTSQITICGANFETEDVPSRVEVPRDTQGILKSIYLTHTKHRDSDPS